MSTTESLLSLLQESGAQGCDEEIVQAALEQFALTGVRRTSTDDIARRAGVNRATVYRRLGPRSDIVGTAFLYEAGRVLSAIESELPDEIDDVDAYIVAFFTTTLTTLRENVLLQRLLDVDRDETLHALTLQAGPVLSLASAYVAEHVRRIRATVDRRNDPDRSAPDGTVPDAGVSNGGVSGGGVSDDGVAALSDTLARLTQSLLLTPDAGPPLSTPQEMRAYAEQILVPMIRGR
ncbi:TetR/AcrR family transcriptional regulator [Gordonia shandongensis]|uniref:TetR/AcrR family transcriptional regulator n=1 Tax=Gordonia shandongensis TaxID=376351 RepID=UPI00040B4448|nr:TetR/AcrR family transcriptional regulator [Gordonia shandongensis]